MRRWLVNGVVGLYPRTIRERYGEEISDLLVNSPTPVRDLADVAWCALRDRITQQPEPMRCFEPAQVRSLWPNCY